MLEAIVQPSLDVEIIQTPTPTPADGELLIKVVCAGTNPKDFKSVVFSNNASNSGDDVAGVVERVGAKVTGFRQGDRVAAFHRMRTSGGAFAEYAIAPATTTFHLPDQISFEEAATIPLAAFTASVGLFHYLQLNPPWAPTVEPTPLVVYGASGAVGLFVIKMARRSNIHPIIAIAGAGAPIVEQHLDASKGDVVVDYRPGPDHIVKSVHQALQAQGIDGATYAFDTISEHGSVELMPRLLAPGGHATFVLLEKDYSVAAAAKLVTSLTYVGYVHTGPFPIKPNQGLTSNPDGYGGNFGAVYSALISKGLQDGWLKGHPYEVIPGGLRGLPTALRNLKEGRASAVKYVVRIGETVA